MLNKYGDNISQEVGLTTQLWLIMLYLAGAPNIPYFDGEQPTKACNNNLLKDLSTKDKDQFLDYLAHCNNTIIGHFK